MGLKEAVVSVFSKYATFSGRATRSEYWFFYLFNLIMSFGLIGAQWKSTGDVFFVS